MVLLTACTATKGDKALTEEKDIPKAFQGKVLVTLLQGQTPEVLERDFTKYSLNHVAVASRNMNQHLFSFNMNKISTEDLLKKLNKSKKVYQADALSQDYRRPTLQMNQPVKKPVVK